MDDQSKKLAMESLQRQSAQAVESYLVAAIEMLDRHLDPAFFEQNPALLGDMVKAMAIQHQADMAQQAALSTPLTGAGVEDLANCLARVAESLNGIGAAIDNHGD